MHILTSTALDTALYSCMHSPWLTCTLMSWLGVTTSENSGFRVKIYGHKFFGPLSMIQFFLLNTSAPSVCGFVRPGNVAECLKLMGWLKGFGLLLYIPPSQSEKWFSLNVVHKKMNDSPHAFWRCRCDCGPVNSGYDFRATLIQLSLDGNSLFIIIMVCLTVLL